LLCFGGELECLEKIENERVAWFAGSLDVSGWDGMAWVEEELDWVLDLEGGITLLNCCFDR
jgi:hypothetical protein